MDTLSLSGIGLTGVIGGDEDEDEDDAVDMDRDDRTFEVGRVLS